MSLAWGMEHGAWHGSLVHWFNPTNKLKSVYKPLPSVGLLYYLTTNHQSLAIGLSVYY